MLYNTIRKTQHNVCCITLYVKPQVLGDRMLLFSWKTISPFFSFFLVFLWLTCAILSEKSHYFISSEKSHYFLQFAIQPLPRSILIWWRKRKLLDTTIRKQTQITQIRHEPSYKLLEVKINWTSSVCGNPKLFHCSFNFFDNMFLLL